MSATTLAHTTQRGRDAGNRVTTYIHNNVVTEFSARLLPYPYVHVFRDLK